MAAASAILVPLQCEFFALEGLSQLLKTVDQVKQALNPDLTIHGIVLTYVRRAQQSLRPGRCRRARVHGTESVRHGDPAQRAAFPKAPSHGKPVLIYDLKCVGSEAYLRLATEIIQRERALKELQAS